MNEEVISYSLDEDITEMVMVVYLGNAENLDLYITRTRDDTRQ